MHSCTRAHLDPCLQFKYGTYLFSVPYRAPVAQIAVPPYRAPTPLTKDVSGEYPLSILPSLSFAFLSSSLFGCPFLFVSTSAAVFHCWPLVFPFWSVTLTRP